LLAAIKEPSKAEPSKAPSTEQSRLPSACETPGSPKVFDICSELPSNTKDQVGFVVSEFSEQIDTLVGCSCPLCDSSRACSDVIAARRRH